MRPHRDWKLSTRLKLARLHDVSTCTVTKDVTLSTSMQSRAAQQSDIIWQRLAALAAGMSMLLQPHEQLSKAWPRPCVRCWYSYHDAAAAVRQLSKGSTYLPEHVEHQPAWHVHTEGFLVAGAGHA